MSYKSPQTREEALAYLKKVFGHSTRQLEGDEYNKVWLLLQLTEPYRSSNNQRTSTDEYHIGDKIYDVTYGLEDTPVIEERIPYAVS